MMSDPMKAISKVTEILESIPESKEILEKLKRGEMGPQEATKSLHEIVLRTGHAGSVSRAHEELRESFTKDNPRVWMDHSNGTRVVNPVMVSVIMERASLDGDVPEFRAGPIPEDGKPAVPVITMSLDSVNIGMQLELASEETASRIGKLVDSHRELLESINSEIMSDPNSVTAIAAAENLPPVPTGVMGYEEGKKAVPISVREVETKEVAVLSGPERSRYTYTTLCTTQGRISVSMSIESNLRLYLEEKGFEVSEKELPECSRYHWNTVCWGSKEVNPEWNPVSMVFNKWCAVLSEECKKDDPISIKVIPISEIPDRRFGWTLVVGKKG